MSELTQPDCHICAGQGCIQEIGKTCPECHGSGKTASPAPAAEPDRMPKGYRRIEAYTNDQEIVASTFGKTPDVRHPDAVLLDWFEKRWKQDDDCPIGADSDGTFFPLCESGVWDSDLDLRGAIRAAMEAERENRE